MYRDMMSLYQDQDRSMRRAGPHLEETMNEKKTWYLSLNSKYTMQKIKSFTDPAVFKKVSSKVDRGTI